MGPTDEVLISIVRSRRFLWWLRTIILFLVAIAIVRSSGIDFNLVPTASMVPTLLPGDHIAVNKLAFDLKFPFTTLRLLRWSSPKRGDVVVLISPGDGLRLVKRIVAVGGDRIALRDNRLVINDIVSDYTLTTLGPPSVWSEIIDGRPHQMQADLDTTRHDFSPVTIPVDHYFVMGDNRDACLDSRTFGPVSRNAILGRVERIVYSFDPATWFGLRNRWWLKLD